MEKSSPLGVDISKEVADAQITCQWVKLTNFVRSQQKQTVSV